MATVDITMFFILLSLFFRFFDCYHNAMMLRVVAVGAVLVVDDDNVVFVADVWEWQMLGLSSPSAIAELVRLDFLISISMDSIA